MRTKLIAMYLPQYHCIPENDENWGKGFTDWVTVKKARPLFKGHNQPVIPLNDNYYDLSLEKNVKWQADLAKKYGIDGFGIYHYWFNNDKNILTRPAEIFRDCKDVDMNYFLAWDNASWVRSWSNIKGNAWAPSEETKMDKKGRPIMIEYIIGGEDDWKNHFSYLISHFKSEKYIKVDNKPVFIIFNYDEHIKNMCSYWNQLAIDEGFSGMFFIFKNEINVPSNNNVFKYEPLHSGWPDRTLSEKMYYRLNKYFGIKIPVSKFNYDDVWNKIINNARKDKDSKIYHGAFVRYDDTPRRGAFGKVVKGASAIKFKNYIKELLDISNSQGKHFVFLTAWNEWGEGAYLEPDTSNGYEYLEALQND